MNSFIYDGCSEEYPIEDAVKVNTPNLAGIVMCKNCIDLSNMNILDEIGKEDFIK